MEISLHAVTRIVVEPYITEDEEGKYPTLQKWKRVLLFNGDERLLAVTAGADYSCHEISVEILDKRAEPKSAHPVGDLEPNPHINEENPNPTEEQP
jgi:hypothetical protein